MRVRSLLFTASLAVRNLVTRKSRTVLTVGGIVLGVAVVLAVAITNESTLASIHRIFDEASGRASLIVTSDSAIGDAFDADTLVRTTRLPGVEQVAPSVTHRTLLVDDVGSWDVQVSVAGARSTNDLLLFGVDPEIDRSMRDYEILAGEFLPSDSDAYVALLVQDYADDKGFSVGDDITILTDSGSEMLRIVGIIAKSGPGMQNGGAVVIVPIGVVQALFEMGNDVTQLDVLAAPAIADSPRLLDDLRLRLSAELGDGVQVLYPAARGKVVSHMLAAYQLGLSFFSAIALFVGAFLIYNTFSMTVVERTQEIGMLRTLGASRAQMTQLILFEAVLLGVLGSVAGAGVGLALSKGLTRSVALVSATEITQVAIPLDGLLTSLGVGIIVTLVSALLPAWRARNISPLEAMRTVARPQRLLFGSWGWLVGLVLIAASYFALYIVPFRANVQYEVGVASVLFLMLGATLVIPITIAGFERVLRPLVTRIYGTVGRIGVANIQRSQGRTVLTVAALMVGIAMVMGIQVLTASFETDITNWVDTAIGGDLYVRSPNPMREEFGLRLLAEPAVAQITPITYRYVSYVPQQGETERLMFTGVDPATYMQVASFVFQDSQADPAAALARLAAGDAVLVSSTLADRYGLGEGDSLTLETRRGKQKFEVAGVVMDFSSSGYVVNGNRDDLDRYFGEGTVDQFIVSLKPGTDVLYEATRLEDRYGSRRHIVVETTTEFRDKVLDLTGQAFALFDVLGLIGIIVAALGVVNTLVMNVLERQREIGGLRSLGMTKLQVAGMVLSESGTMGVMGGVFGVVFGLFLSKMLLLGSRVIAGYGVNYVFPPIALVTSLIIALVVSQVAALYPADRAASLPIIEAIQHE